MKYTTYHRHIASCPAEATRDCTMKWSGPAEEMIGRPGAYHPALSAALYDAIRDRTSPDGPPAPSTQPVERGNGETHQEEQARALPDAIFQRDRVCKCAESKHWLPDSECRRTVARWRRGAASGGVAAAPVLPSSWLRWWGDSTRCTAEVHEKWSRGVRRSGSFRELVMENVSFCVQSAGLRTNAECGVIYEPRTRMQSMARAVPVGEFL